MSGDSDIAAADNRVAAEIEQRLLNGQLGPGSRLPDVSELMAEFEVREDVLRAALAVLEAGGVIRVHPDAAPEILPFSAEMLRSAVSRMAELDALELADLVRLRMMLEGWAYQLAARRVTPADLVHLDAALAAMAGSVAAGPDEFARADVAFHRAMALASGNAMLQVGTDAVGGVVERLIGHHLDTVGDARPMMEGAVALHREVLAAVRAGDGDRAARLAMQSLRDYLTAASMDGPALASEPVRFTEVDVVEFLDVAAAAGVSVWLDGGWGVDALLDEQTRDHSDLDVVVEGAELAPLLAALTDRGFTDAPAAYASPPEHVVRTDPAGRTVDIHVIERDPRGNGRFGSDDVYPAAALTGTGTVARRAVRCISPEWAVQFHTGYAVDSDDWHDVSALCARFGLPVPPEYARWHTAVVPVAAVDRDA